MDFVLHIFLKINFIYDNNIKMSVRNIEQGFYNLPDTSITLNTSVALIRQ